MKQGRLPSHRNLVHAVFGKLLKYDKEVFKPLELLKYLKDFIKLGIVEQPGSS